MFEHVTTDEKVYEEKIKTRWSLKKNKWKLYFLLINYLQTATVSLLLWHLAWLYQYLIYIYWCIQNKAVYLFCSETFAVFTSNTYPKKRIKIIPLNRWNWSWYRRWWYQCPTTNTCSEVMPGKIRAWFSNYVSWLNYTLLYIRFHWKRLKTGTKDLKITIKK